MRREMDKKHNKKNGQLPYWSKTPGPLKNMKDMGTNCKCFESVCIIKVMHKGIKQTVLDLCCQIIFELKWEWRVVLCCYDYLKCAKCTHT